MHAVLAAMSQVHAAQYGVASLLHGLSNGGRFASTPVNQGPMAHWYRQAALATARAFALVGGLDRRVVLGGDAEEQAKA